MKKHKDNENNEKIKAYKEILKEVAVSIAGEKAKSIIDILYEKKNVNEFFITKRLHLMINQTRHILYRLADEGLVSFVRKKDSKKGGWYTYFWTLHIDKGMIKFKETLLRCIESLRQQIHLKKTERYYSCLNCHLNMNEEQALQHNYICLECGEVLMLEDSLKEVALLGKELAKQEKILSEIDAALASILEKKEKKRQKKLESEEKKKRKERNAGKARRKKDKQKLNKLLSAIKAKKIRKRAKKKI